MIPRRMRTEIVWLIVPMLLAFGSVRVILYAAPGVGGREIGGYHVHHLLIGILLLALGGVPSILIRVPGASRSAAIAAFGFGLGLALDEWVLFVLRGVSPLTRYSSRGSIVGASVLTALTALYALAIALWLPPRADPIPDGSATADPERHRSG
jgi:hypothetical protein